MMRRNTYPCVENKADFRFIDAEKAHRIAFNFNGSDSPVDPRISASTSLDNKTGNNRRVKSVGNENGCMKPNLNPRGRKTTLTRPTNEGSQRKC